MRGLVFLGKLLISLGCGVLLFVAWTLWGTGFYTVRRQAVLEQAFAVAAPVEAMAPKGTTEETTVIVPANFRPGPGEAAFRLRIPSIGVKKIVVEGVDSEQLRMGPGHYPTCGKGFSPPFCLDGIESFWPGEAGRVIVSGHRTTYGAPFYDLDRLRKGHEIVTETKWGTFTYVVTESVVVDDDEAITMLAGEPEIVLTTCNPKFSAAERLLVFARLQETETT